MPETRFGRKTKGLRCCGNVFKKNKEMNQRNVGKRKRSEVSNGVSSENWALVKNQNYTKTPFKFVRVCYSGINELSIIKSKITDDGKKIHGSSQRCTVDTMLAVINNNWDKSRYIEDWRHEYTSNDPNWSYLKKELFPNDTQAAELWVNVHKNCGIK